MKKLFQKNKKWCTITALSLLSLHSFSQQGPTGTSASSKDWHRGGNSAAPSGNIDNLLGTSFNSPIYFETNGSIRMTLMGTTTSNSGFLGIGTTTPQQMLHIHDGAVALARKRAKWESA